MAWKQYIFPDQCSTVMFEVWNWVYEIYFSGPCIPSDCELEAKFWGVVNVSLVEHPFVVYRDFEIVTEEVGNVI